jgi:hypothetical protein
LAGVRERGVISTLGAGIWEGLEVLSAAGQLPDASSKKLTHIASRLTRGCLTIAALQRTFRLPSV